MRLFIISVLLGDPNLGVLRYKAIRNISCNRTLGGEGFCHYIQQSSVTGTLRLYKTSVVTVRRVTEDSYGCPSVGWSRTVVFTSKLHASTACAV